MSTSARDELADLIWRVETRDLGGVTLRDAEAIADALLAAGWRKVDPAAEQRAEKAEAALDRVRDLHQEVDICVGSTESYCNEDGMPWPCTTIRALEGES